jgi:hypothetical protein
LIARDACLYYLREFMALRSRPTRDAATTIDRPAIHSCIRSHTRTPAHTLIQRCRSSCHASSHSWSCSYSPSRRTPSTVTHDVTRTTHTKRPDQTRQSAHSEHGRRMHTRTHTHSLTHSLMLVARVVLLGATCSCTCCLVSRHSRAQPTAARTTPMAQAWHDRCRAGLSPRPSIARY